MHARTSGIIAGGGMVRRTVGGGMAAATEPIINILSERVALGPRVREHLPLFSRWGNDFRVARTFGGTPRARTVEALAEAYDAGEGHEYAFTVYERATWRPIGWTYFANVDWRARTAAFGIVIGEADARGKGYGTEATRLMLDYAFTALGLHSVMLTTDSYNLAGQAAYRKAGFKEFGRRRECALLNGTYHDWVYMDCLASEFTSPVLGAVFAPDTPRFQRPMPDLQLVRLDHAPALLAFEQENRTYFAASIPDRGDEFFAEFDMRHAQLLEGQAAGTDYFHLLVAEGGEVVGRVNLVEVTDRSAELGYRIAQKAAGQGLATAAVRKVRELAATEYGLTKLRARVTLDNPASRKVLEHNGFVAVSELTLNGKPAISYICELR